MILSPGDNVFVKALSHAPVPTIPPTHATINFDSPPSNLSPQKQKKPNSNREDQE
jgi:hypothetical protein